jgi:hypothetical protein
VLLAPATGLFGGGITYVLVRLKRGWRSAPKVTTPAEKDGAKDAAKDDAKEQPLGT